MAVFQARKGRLLKSFYSIDRPSHQDLSAPYRMFRFIWLFIKTALSAVLLLLAFVMLSALFRFDLGGAIFIGLIALVLIAMAIVPWLFSRPEKKKDIKKEKRSFFSHPPVFLKEPESRKEKAILSAFSAPFFAYALFWSYWSLMGLLSTSSTPVVTTGLVKSIVYERRTHILVMKTQGDEMKFDISCRPQDIGPGDEISVSSRDNQRNPFNGMRRAILIQKDETILCSSMFADPERWQVAKFFDVLVSIISLGFLAFSADFLLISLGLKSKLKALLGLGAEKRIP